MIDFKDALELAKKCWNEVDFCAERENAYVFSKKDDLSFGGPGPVAVMKEDGSCIAFPVYLSEYREKELRSGYIEDFEQ